jgi:hypothetical protein
MAVELTTRERIERTLNFEEVDVVTTGAIHPGVKPENAVALFRAAKKYGRPSK